jgi:lipid II:glycine glycyltransferase (peptidoglycan interpeptide bridge formation enzyme)
MACHENTQKEDINWIDLGGIDWQEHQGIAFFKSGMGPDIFTLAGSYA